MPLLYLFLLFFFQLSGEVVKTYLNLPVPGAIIGMLMLLTYLALTPANENLKTTCQTLISHLPLFFIPAGVGILAYLAEVKAYGLSIGVALIAGTFIGFVFSLLVLKKVLRSS
ncbi:MAG: CidA/LrgA family protein [Hahellaceae bacterium]|nr:CidA/LrgA family protein [Hahellaceae bacterium]MCP5211255.1 CidA/LrgA family protein [Hahellaceae bacterium]